MALNYSAVIVGTMTLRQTHQDGTKHTYKMQFRACNALACLIEVTPAERKEGEKQLYYHRLIWFAVDVEHLKRMANAEGGLKSYFYGSASVRLNIYYKDNETLARYFAKAGIKTEIYYKEPKRAKAKKGTKSAPRVKIG